MHYIAIKKVSYHEYTTIEYRVQEKLRIIEASGQKYMPKHVKKAVAFSTFSG
jgi:hypothetical protein